MNKTDPRHFLYAYRSNVQCYVLAHRKNLGGHHYHAQLHQCGTFFAKTQCELQTHAMLLSFRCVATCLPSVEIGSTTSSIHGIWTEDLRVHTLASQNRVRTLPFPIVCVLRNGACWKGKWTVRWKVWIQCRSHETCSSTSKTLCTTLQKYHEARGQRLPASKGNTY